VIGENDQVLGFGAVVDRWLAMCGNKMVPASSWPHCLPDYTVP